MRADLISVYSSRTIRSGSFVRPLFMGFFESYATFIRAVSIPGMFISAMSPSGKCDKMRAGVLSTYPLRSRPLSSRGYSFSSQSRTSGFRHARYDPSARCLHVVPWGSKN